MDIQLKKSTMPAWQDLARPTKAVQITMESVVPDSKEDIGRILSVRPELYLKSKEVRNHGVSITGEAVAVLLYITEAESSVSSFRFSQNFSIEYELPAVDDSCLAQIRLLLSNIQARIVNPRKAAVDLEINGDLTVSRRSECVVAQELPEDVGTTIHLQQSESQATFITSVTEKSFSINEQLSFPEDSDRPKELIAKDVSYKICETEAVGGRLLIKGEAQAVVHYFPETGDAPGSRQFTVPFSQLLDLGEEEAEAAEVWILPTSDYIDLMDAIDGSKLIDLELHGLIQARGRRTQPLSYVSDAYSNWMPCVCETEEFSLTERQEECAIELLAEENIELPEECREVLSTYLTLISCSASQGTAVVDVLYRVEDGKLGAMRRNLNMHPAQEYGETACGAFLLREQSCRIDGRNMSIRATAESSGLQHKYVNLLRVGALTLDESMAFDNASYPSLTAVWAETESVWELAKLYHSSPEAIRSINENASESPVFIPKTK